MAYLLRHDPGELEMDGQGFVPLDSLLAKLGNRWSTLTREEIIEVVREDPKGRYQIKDDLIRARYGHSIPVDPLYEDGELDEEILFHGTTPEAKESIMKEGLKSQGREKVHLSADKEEAKKVGSRRTVQPVILRIEASLALQNGIEISKASPKVYVAEDIPPRYICVSS